MKWISIIIFVLLSSFVYAGPYGAGPYGSGIYGVGEVPPESEPSPSGSNEGSGIIATTQEQIAEQLKQTLGGPSAFCEENATFINRLFSKCKISNNSICDDGETFLMDDDCNVTSDDIVSGKILEYMWLLRLMFLLSIFLLAIGNKKFPLVVTILLLLAAYNGAFSLIEPVTSIETDISAENASLIPSTDEISCMDVNFLINFGHCVTPNIPMMGWSVMFIVLVMLLMYLMGRNKKKT